MFDRHTIETPENIAFGYEVAGIGSRFLATAVDTFIQGVLYVFFFISLTLVVQTDIWDRMPAGLSNWVGAFLVGTLFLIQFGYYLLFEIATGGQSPGKRLFGLRVVKENGFPLSPLDSVIRNVIRVIDFMPVAYGLGLIVMFLNARSRRLGDFAAGTLVVKQRERITLAELTRPPSLPAAGPAATGSLDLAGIQNLRENDIELVETFLQRQPGLQNAETLAAQIARPLRARMHLPEAPNGNGAQDLEFLRSVAAAYRQRLKP